MICWACSVSLFAYVGCFGHVDLGFYVSVSLIAWLFNNFRFESRRFFVKIRGNRERIHLFYSLSLIISNNQTINLTPT